MEWYEFFTFTYPQAILAVGGALLLGLSLY